MKRYAAEHIIINGKEDIEPWKNRYFIEEPEVISKLDEQRALIEQQAKEIARLHSLLQRAQTIITLDASLYTIWREDVGEELARSKEEHL